MGKWSNLTNMYQLGPNHRLVTWRAARWCADVGLRRWPWFVHCLCRRSVELGGFLKILGSSRQLVIQPVFLNDLPKHFWLQKRVIMIFILIFNLCTFPFKKTRSNPREWWHNPYFTDSTRHQLHSCWLKFASWETYCTSCKWIGGEIIPIHWNMFSGSNELCHEYHEYPSIARKTWRQSLRFFVACFFQACRDIRRYLESHTTKPLNHKRKSPHLGNWVSSVQTEKGLFVHTCLNRKL